MALNGKFRFEDLTWPEVNEAVQAGMIPVLPVGTVEQHGPHLPIKMDRWTATEVSNAAAERHPERLLVMPPIPYGYTTHVMDFPGSITVHHETFINYVADVLKSVAYHGFRRIIVINGHGSNMPPLDLACRRANMESEASVALASWWAMTAADPDFAKQWRESKFPGGCAHSGEAETSMALHMDESLVQMDKAVNEEAAYNRKGSKFRWVDLWAAGPVNITKWTSNFTESGVSGEAKLGTAEKGRLLFEEAVKNLADFAEEWAADELPKRVDHHVVKPQVGTPG